jgi:glycosyltransferase involved in cell wall biosynthesis
VNATNLGKGKSVWAGIQMATFPFVLIQDADLEYSPEEYPRLLAPLIDGRADVVYGSRFMKGNHQVHRTFHFLINYLLTLMSNIFSGIYLSDMETCYKLFKSDIIKNIELKSNRFGFEPEITAKIARLKIRVMEVPISYYPRNYLEGKKISWKDGIAAIKHILFFNIIYSKESFFKKEIPEDFLPKDKNWL